MIPAVAPVVEAGTREEVEAANNLLQRGSDRNTIGFAIVPTWSGLCRVHGLVFSLPRSAKEEAKPMLMNKKTVTKEASPVT